MINSNKVVWFEGMFLQPQHFQQHERYLEGVMQHKQQAVNQNIWGFSTLELDLELLSIGKLGIAACQGIFPDGTPIAIPNNTKPPCPFEIPEGLDNCMLYLAIPLRKQGVAEVGQNAANTLFRYHPETMELADNTADSAELATIQVGNLACQILTEQDDLSAYAVLPIARILESRSNYQIRLDKMFLPPCLDVQVFLPLANLIREFHGLLNHRAEMLAGRLTDTQHVGTAETVDFMLLQLVNRYGPLFHYLCHKKPLHPEELFRVLIQLMGEMATFTNDKRRPIEPPVYQHEAIYASFQPVIAELRHALSMVLEQNATSIPLQARGQGVYVGQINDKELLTTCNFVLAAYAEIPAETLRKQFPQQTKVAAVEKIKVLVSRALPGIPISAIAVAPRQIPYHANFSYFSLAQNSELWQQLQRSGGIAFHIGGHYPGLKLELWAIRG